MDTTTRQLSSRQGSLLLVLLLATIASSVDVRVGEDVTLECRFNPTLMDKRHTFYWIRANSKDKDNVAIGESPLEKNYRISFKPAEGQYDLLVSGATFDRDNGRFECRLKEQGTGIELHAQSVDLVVLVPPEQTQISPVSPVAVEGQPSELVCSSTGGSPDPVLRWYKRGEANPLEGAVVKASGGMKNVATMSTLVVRPTKEDDGAEYRCVAWNRAMDANEKREATVQLTVNYAPRVRVSPSPLSVERGGSVQIHCQVDAKPAVYSVRWTRAGRYIATSFNHTLRSVTLEDDGNYVCSADNGLGQIGEAELQLDVLHPPVVTIENAKREVEIGGGLSVACNVSAKPAPTSIEWLKEGDTEAKFRSVGPVLRISRVAATDNGRYFCRAANTIAGIERNGNATFQLMVRHEPGTAKISPEEPVVVDDGSITLTCLADPPGWPTPQYRWWKAGAEATILAVNNEYTIQNARQGHEGTYYCQPSNELGTGGSSYVNLRVYQAPKFNTQLAPVLQKKAGDADFNVTCSAMGKPRPSITWLKDGQEILPGSTEYELVTDESEGRNSIFTVRSALRFRGSQRPALGQLTADDRGVYTCAFENQIKRIESTLTLKIEHAPILLDHRPKVAANVGSLSAILVCQVQAYPRPSFEWSFRDQTILPGSGPDGKYETNVTAAIGQLTAIEQNNDIYQGMLKIADIRDSDYGDYTCKTWNSEGENAAAVRLQQTGPPEQPTNLRLVHAGYDSMTLEWDQGFNGGFDNTIYTILYSSESAGGQQEDDCQYANPCVIRNLDQLHSYSFQVRAENTKGQSAASNPLTASTVLDLSRIPEPKQVTFRPKDKAIAFHVDSPLSLIALVESLNGLTNEWTLTQKIPVRSPISHEIVDQMPDDADDVRIRLCLEANTTLCSEPVTAITGDLIQEPTKALTDLPAKYMVAIIVACVVGSLVFALFAVFYCYRRRRAQKLKKLLEMEKAHHSSSSAANGSASANSRAVQQQGGGHPPPPYYAGLENKGRDHSLMDTSHASMLDDPKNALYATQNGYGYAVAGHNGPTNQNGHANGGDWVNLAYTEHSYSNSNNGGSVNSQDSLWQLKLAAQNGEQLAGGAGAHHQDRSYHHYDPMTHGGYGGFEDYSHYPPSNGDEYQQQQQQQQQQRNNYVVANNGDPYAAVHKNNGAKRMADHLESTYHNVSGLPDPYMEAEQEEAKQHHPAAHHQQQQHLSFDESLESGYSTPNSRNRRVIREIIV